MLTAFQRKEIIDQLLWRNCSNRKPQRRKSDYRSDYRCKRVEDLREIPAVGHRLKLLNVITGKEEARLKANGEVAINRSDRPQNGPTLGKAVRAGFAQYAQRQHDSVVGFPGGAASRSLSRVRRGV